MPKKTKRTKGHIGGKVAGYKTWAICEKSFYYQENLKAGRNDLLADMKRSYEPNWKPPADIVEKQGHIIAIQIRKPHLIDLCTRIQLLCSKGYSEKQQEY